MRKQAHPAGTIHYLFQQAYFFISPMAKKTFIHGPSQFRLLFLNEKESSVFVSQILNIPKLWFLSLVFLYRTDHLLRYFINGNAFVLAWDVDACPTQVFQLVL